MRYYLEFDPLLFSDKVAKSPYTMCEPHGPLLEVNNELYVVADLSDNLLRFNPATQTSIVLSHTEDTPISPIQGPATKLYGVIRTSGFWHIGPGRYYVYDPANSLYTEFFANNDPNRPYFGNPSGQLLWASDGMFYGLTTGAGKNDKGYLYQIDPYSNGLVNKIDFDDLGAESPSGSLIQASNGKLYGFTVLGGLYNKGIIFEYDLLTNTCVKKHDFDGVNGALRLKSL